MTPVFLIPPFITEILRFAQNDTGHPHMDADYQANSGRSIGSNVLACGLSEIALPSL